MQSVKLKDGAVASATETHVYVLSDEVQSAVASTDTSAPISTNRPDTKSAQPQALAASANIVAGPVEQSIVDASAGWRTGVLSAMPRPADGRGVEMSLGDGYSSKSVGDYQIDPGAPGRLIANTFDEDGKPVRAPVSVDASGAVTVQLSEKRRSITALDASGALIKTRQELSWGGEWKISETQRFIDPDPGPEWGVFAKLVGYNWKYNDYFNLNFVWLPTHRVIQARMGDMWDEASTIDFSLRPEQPRELVARSFYNGEKDHFFGAPIGLVVIESDTKATQIFAENRFTYELVAPDKLVLHSERWRDGEFRKYDTVYVREDRAEKDERVAAIKRWQEARASSERTTRFMQAMEQMNGALTAANQVASARAAQSQANLDATLATMSAQLERERLEAASRAAQEKMDRERNAIAQAQPIASAVTEAEPDRAAKPKQAGTNKMLPNQYVLNTATNSVAPAQAALEPVSGGTTAGAGKVRLCARPGDETHYDPCPKENPRDRQGKTGQTGGIGGNGDGGTAGGASGSGKVGGGGSTVPVGGYPPKGKPGSDPVTSGGKKPGGESGRPRAKAWCTKGKKGGFMCMGPLQDNRTFYPTLEVALSMAGCPKGFGYTPTVGSGSSFDCGRDLTHGEDEMPLYDPY